MRNNNNQFKFGRRLYLKNFVSNKFVKGLGRLGIFAGVGGLLSPAIGVIGKADALGGNILSNLVSSAGTIGMTSLACIAGASALVAVIAIPAAFKNSPVKPTAKIAAGILTAALATTAITSGITYGAGSSAFKKISTHQVKKEFNKKIVRKADVLAGDVTIITPKKSAQLKR